MLDSKNRGGAPGDVHPDYVYDRAGNRVPWKSPERKREEGRAPVRKERDDGGRSR